MISSFLDDHLSMVSGADASLHASETSFVHGSVSASGSDYTSLDSVVLISNLGSGSVTSTT